jgi:hypothetical protein
MKLLFILISCLFLVQNKSFYEKVLNDFESNSRFIMINVKSSEYNGPVIIENDKFFYFLNQKQHLNENEYKLFVEKKLQGNLTFNLGTTNLGKWDFIKMPKIKKVENNAKKGIEKIIKLYFDSNKVLKEGISDDERAVIIMILFKHQLSSYIDDETGYLVIG